MSGTMDTTTRRWGRGLRTVGRLGAALHRGLYRTSGGKVGGVVRGVPVALLTTRGRKSGRVYTWPVCYLAEGDNLLLIASAGGSPQHPAWYHNLRADPNVTIQVAGRSRAMVAEPQSGAERTRYWARIVREHPLFADYQRKVTREIPVVLLRPAPAAGMERGAAS